MIRRALPILLVCGVAPVAGPVVAGPVVSHAVVADAVLADAVLAHVVAPPRASAPTAQSQRTNDVWRDVFVALARLESLPRGSTEFEALWTSLRDTATERERSGRKAQDAVTKYRARTVLFHLQRLRGLPTRPATEPDVVMDWLPGEAWYAARALVPGYHRVLAAATAVRETPAILDERVAVARDVSEEERLLLRLELAELPARAVFERRADADSAGLFARILAARGRTDEALEVLGRVAASATDEDERARLLVRRARIARAAGRERVALADLGAALARGNPEAALECARHALQEGNGARARAAATLALSEPSTRDAAVLAFGRALLFDGPPPGEHAQAPGAADTKTVR